MTVPSKLSDEALVSRINAANSPLEAEAEWRELVRRYEPQLRPIFQKHIPYQEVNDALQEFWLRLIRSALRNFKGTAPLAHFLSRTALFVAITWQRRTIRNERSFIVFSDLSDEQRAIIESGVSSSAAVAAMCSFSEQRSDSVPPDALAKALAQLAKNSPKAHEALVLRHLNGLSHGEIGQQTGQSEAASKHSVHRAIQFLRKKLKIFLS
jgi:RNA polymerase sigma factor (sigma-70 family)